MVKKILLGFLAAFVALQFFRPAKNISLTPPGKDDFLVRHDAPPEVRRLFSIACYDCHSNNTRYPWYAEVQPLGWWLKEHVDDGLSEVDFSQLGGASARRQAHRIDDMIDDISDRSMPLKAYTWIHHDAKLSEAQIKLLTDWLESVRDKFDADE